MVLGSQISGQQSLIKEPEWHQDLQALGYELPLPPPIPIIQATLASLKPGDIHAYIQKTDTKTIKSNGDEGESPLILSTLDLSQWTRIFEVANGKKPELGLVRLKELQAILTDLISTDAEEYANSQRDAIIVEVAIRAANNKDDPELSNSQKLACRDKSSISHPFLEGMDMEPNERTAIEDLQELIICTQKQKEEAELIASGKRLAILFTPPRTVEDMLISCDHRVWQVGNINLLAPIPPFVWRIWGGLLANDMKESKDSALNNRAMSTIASTISNAFSLSSFDHTKCSTDSIKMQCKIDPPTDKHRRDKHMQELWNGKRPYMKCSCAPNANTGCTSSMIWWDHAIWFMANHLDRFFEDTPHPSLKSKFSAFLVWLHQAGSLAIKCHVSFMHARKWICEGAKQLAENASGPLFKENTHLPGLKQVERLLKPTSWSLANPDRSSQAPLSKRQKLMTPPSGGGSTARGRGNVGGARGYGRGRGQNYYNSPGQTWGNSPNWQRFNKNSNVTGQNSNQGKRQSPWSTEPPRSVQTPETIPAFSAISICESFGSDTIGQHGSPLRSGGQTSTGMSNTPKPNRIQILSESPLKRKALSFADENEE